MVIDEIGVVLACSPSHDTVEITQTRRSSGLREARVVQSVAQQVKIRLCISFVSGQDWKGQYFLLFSIQKDN